jgi:hypothetical protein
MAATALVFERYSLPGLDANLVRDAGLLAPDQHDAKSIRACDQTDPQAALSELQAVVLKHLIEDNGELQRRQRN